ncbi:MAG: acyl-CoA dehydrogenase family protein, partial [Chloroflexota bacterium]
MTTYNPPLKDIQFTLNEVANYPAIAALPGYEDATPDLIEAVLEEGGKFASRVLAPLNQIGDHEGAKWHDGEVTTPPGFKEAYRQFSENGWNGVGCETEFGGQGLPKLIGAVLQEMWKTANMGFSLGPLLTTGAVEALMLSGTEDLKHKYLPNMVSGKWTGTMNLTEPQAGSDLSMVRSRAEPQADGTYRLTGQKIFISAGEHDLAANIVHLVLARLPDAPVGSKGISLFVVPKFNVTADGNVGERNGIYCGGLEHKMGIHGNATCQMVLDGAVGVMVGLANKGLAAMFVMMNGARLGVGNQSLGLTEVAYQNALAYAKDRIQMRSLSGVKAPSKPADPILVHPDVRRMLLTAKAYAEGGRALACYGALLIDKELNH